VPDERKEATPPDSNQIGGKAEALVRSQRRRNNNHE
jgi:hypothetical protein